ncbi:peptide ABC transporter substrate-binding protein [Clostridium sp. UBA4548]|uniref:peptide ABC transporter substrate-binding protein n=1 Tax=Clostridium sp. UBA4548 TaxID=1946361 RepID=UPI0025BBB833|nr:peptide ABC transporter substrate-binding protein [Clostridium sp. UBA4548]
MKSKKVLTLLTATLIAVSTVLSGCGKDKPKEAQGGIDKDQTLNYCFISDVRSLDPSINDDTYGGMVLTDTMEALTRVEQDEKGNDVIKPAGATKWDVSPDGLTYTFHLRDFNWEDGKKVTSKDYAYSLMRTLEPATGATYVQLIDMIKGASAYNGGTGKKEDVGITTPDDNTLVITLEKPTPYFMNLTYFTLFMPQRQDMVEKNAKNYGADAGTLLSCGPFKLKEWVHDSKIVLEKNENYYDKDKVKLNTVNIKVIKEEEAEMQELYNGGLDMANVTKQDWKEKFNATGKMDLLENIEPSTSYFHFNQTATINGVKLFSNAKVRRAFSVALDRQQIVDMINDGAAVPATGWVPLRLQLNGEEFRKASGFDPVSELQKEIKDPKAYLIEGLKELGGDTDPSKYTVHYIVGNTSALGKKNAEVYQQMLQKALGVNIAIDTVESKVKRDRIKALDYELSNLAWIGDYNDPSTFMNMWYTTRPNYNTGWANKKYDELMDKASSTSDQKQRLQYFKDAEKLLVYEDATIAPTVFNKHSEFQYKYVKGVMRPTFGSICELKYAYIEGRSK